MATRELKCVIVTPEKALLDTAADFVSLPMFDGELGVLPGRAPLIGRLGFGDLRIRRGAQTQHVYVEGGFAQVRDDTVTVLTAKAIDAKDLKAEDARLALERAQAALKRAVGDEQQQAQLLAEERARAQLRVIAHAPRA
jgi:F-type H+-transporting ATPase subunit epsilon